MKKIFILTGEPSGDKLASEVVGKLIILNPNIQYLSVGGNQLKELGIKSIYDLKDITFFGFTSVLMNLIKIKKKIDFTVNKIIEFNPDILFSVDSPDFTFRVIEKVKKLNKNIKTIHFVAPQVWIWRKYRLKKIKNFLDHVLILFKFEKKYFDEENINCTFVGHPLLDNFTSNNLNPLKAIDIKKNIISIFPGSRLSEIKKLLPICFDFIRLMNGKYSDITYFIHTSVDFDSLIKKEVLQSNILNIEVISDPVIKNKILSKSFFAVVKSGTITLEVSNLKIPFITIYRLNFINFFLVKLFLKIKFVNIINIINNKEIVPELLQNECNPEEIFRTVNYFIKHPELSKEQIKNCQKTLNEIRSESSSSTDVANILINHLII